MRSKREFIAALIGALVLASGKSAFAAEDSIEASLASVFDVERGLRAEDVASSAVSTSPDVRARDAQTAGAEAQASQARVDFLPRLVGTARYTRLSPIDQPNVGTLVVAPSTGAGPIPAGTQLVNVPLAFPVILNQSSAQAQLSIPISDYLLRLSQKYEGAKHAEEAARLQGEATRRIVATNARIAYYDWIRARLSVVVADKGLAVAKQHQTDAQSAFNAGSGSRADVLRAESQVASNELLVARASNTLAKAEDRLRTASHDDKIDLRRVGEDVRMDPPGVDAAGGTEALVLEATRKRREIRALGHSMESLQEQVKVARAAYYPRLDAVGDVTYANPNQRVFPQNDEFRATWSAGVVLSWSPNDALSASAAVRNAKAKESEIAAQKQALADQVRTEVVDAYRALEESNVSLVSARRGVLAAEEGHRVRVALYQTGRATGTELTDTENDLLRSRFDLVNASVDARLARVRLVHALGRD